MNRKITNDKDGIGKTTHSLRQMDDEELMIYAAFIRVQMEELTQRVGMNRQHPAWIDWTQVCIVADKIQVELLRRWLNLEETWMGKNSD